MIGTLQANIVHQQQQLSPPGSPIKPMTSDSLKTTDGVDQLKQKTKGGFMKVKSDIKKVNEAIATNVADLLNKIQKNTDDMTSVSESLDTLR